MVDDITIIVAYLNIKNKSAMDPVSPPSGINWIIFSFAKICIFHELGKFFFDFLEVSEFLFALGVWLLHVFLDKHFDLQFVTFNLILNLFDLYYIWIIWLFRVAKDRQELNKFHFALLRELNLIWDLFLFRIWLVLAFLQLGSGLGRLFLVPH